MTSSHPFPPMDDPRFHEDWRDFVDADGFPVSNEDRAGEVFTHPETGHVLICTFIEGLGWVWQSM